ncbi:hypothetical protein [Streptococcus thermophilus]|mgnify:FL=1|uniref:hypothetical protein n=2 Tax=Streptococcus thermophilus TaxID=1308 RepID=UPI0015C29725|nr:protein of unknown function [Streptococcus thermophilus]CAD0171685.1 protein of unknown function [Streptococcus thermophilus]
MKICLRLHQLLALYSNTNENWDYHEMSLKVADIFDKRDEMKKDLDRVDAKEAVFAENVKAKFSFQKLMYLSVTVNEIRYYAYGHLGYLYDTYKFNRAKPIIQMICSNLKTHLSGVSLKLFKIIGLSMQII